MLSKAWTRLKILCDLDKDFQTKLVEIHWDIYQSSYPWVTRVGVNWQDVIS